MILIVLLLFIIPDECNYSFLQQSFLKLELQNTHFYNLLLSYISLYAEKHFSVICNCQNRELKGKLKASLHQNHISHTKNTAVIESDG